MPDFHRITFPLFTEPIPHLFILRYGSRVSNSRGVHPPRNPHALCSEHRTAAVRPNRAFDDPTPMSQPHKCQACHETERAEIGRVSDEAVRARGYQPMLWFDTEVEGEERPKGFIRPEADESPKGHEGDSKQGDRSDGEVWQFASVRGRRAEGGVGEFRRALRGPEDVVMGDGQKLKGTGDVKQRPLEPKDHGSETKEALSLRLEPALLGSLVGRSRRPLVESDLRDID